jgi:hypothetical protein
VLRRGVDPGRHPLPRATQAAHLPKDSAHRPVLGRGGGLRRLQPRRPQGRRLRALLVGRAGLQDPPRIPSRDADLPAQARRRHRGGRPGLSGRAGRGQRLLGQFLCTFAQDFNRDGYDDLLVVGLPGTQAWVHENPGARTNAAASGHWPRHQVFDVVDNESLLWQDLDGDGRPELICNTGGQLGFIQPDWSAPFAPWKFRPITPKLKYHKYTHGLGVGDVNGDGRLDFPGSRRLVGAAGLAHRRSGLEAARFPLRAQGGGSADVGLRRQWRRSQRCHHLSQPPRLRLGLVRAGPRRRRRSPSSSTSSWARARRTIPMA